MTPLPPIWALLSLGISLFSVGFGVWTYQQKAAREDLQADENRLERVEERLRQCEQSHERDNRLLADLRSENEWLRGENIRLRRRLEQHGISGSA